jgi:sugar/nucleoside kinase (ribokinase family)
LVTNDNLYLQERPLACQVPQRLLVIGEVLWDIFEDGTLLGGAPLNFAAHASRLGHQSILVVAVGNLTGLPTSFEAFCRAGRDRYGWKAACVTLGARGCAILVGDEYVAVGAQEVQVADTVGAGDAFAAAFMHGMSRQWRSSEIAAFANRVGGLVASRPGGIPDWTMAEASTQD